ncbi:D-alanyl-D-alanine carboxypeptidase family protein [Nonomuraea africana]|uniref:D-alanyl-D-alanine carboxypeptidase (Penicillin-binding protein 5/6) n=1 Tax=Nonomuraea africana TaxID=46171 RepID=A0ABR9KL59_9ACTN|nr:serine hydrolase [Nonomuraea africana]MBE1562720.1 D-alanyl-D-alanine carboxypeptidase (penicillin-binding protein 5/6) [Nonomuraea africana]
MRTGGIRLLTGIAALALTVGFSPAVQAERVRTPEVGARAAYVVDSEGTIHFGKRETRRVPVASLVKVMTAYVVLREGRLGDVVTITKADVRHAADNGAASAALRAGEKLTTRDLLYGLMLPSGADAANALARTYGPGKSAFVAKMNAAARSLGLRDTVYTNADGLPTPGNGGYSTAVDQAKLVGAALKDRTFGAVVSKRAHRVAKSAVHRAHTWANTNRLLGKADGVLGVKTGFTTRAGFCLAFAAERNGRRVVGILLGDQDARRFTTAAKLLDFAGEQITTTTP